MAPIWSRRPFKTLYTTFCIFSTLASIPWLLVRYSFRSARPFTEWSLKYCILNAVVRNLFTWYAKTRHDGMSAVTLDHQKAMQRHAVAEPADPSLYSGVLTPSKATPAPVGGLWYPAPLLATSPDAENAKVVLHVPGGAFVLAFGQETWGEKVSSPLLKYSKATHCFYAQYRLAKSSSTRFPAALQDFLTCYNYVLSLGVNPNNIILSGDSAGGNLVLGLLRYLESSTSATIPLPGGAMIWSPWVHVTLQAGADFESSKNSANDSIVPAILQWGAEAYWPEHEPTAEELAYISPLNHPFYTKVPLFIHGGTAEGFFEVVQEFSNQMAQVGGNRARLHATKFAVHDLIMGYDGAGLEEDVEVAIRNAFRLFEQ
ncbi:Alpha/Beta hydrolase protein [Nemania sp. FL0031]|nr:Alpha/Beta hydrolase protein [Nemania sp. FL0031]